MFVSEINNKNNFILNTNIKNLFNKKISNLSPANINILRNKSAILLDEYFFELLQFLKIENFIECGSHDAATSLKVVKLYGIKSIAIEANPITFNTLTLKNKHPKLKLLNLGLSDKNEELNFYIPKDNNLAMNSSFRIKSNQDLQKYNISKIKVLKLDKIIEENLSKDSTFALWVDVEGLSDKVLNGCKKYLNNKSKECKLIKIEVESTKIWKQQIKDKDIIFFLISLGYRPLFRDFEYETQYNLIFIKNSYFDQIYDLTKKYENKFENLKLFIFEKDKSLFEFLRYYKNKILSTKVKSLKYLLHFLFAILGSKSSRNYINNKKHKYK